MFARLWLALAVAVMGCGGDEGGGDDTPLGGSLTVTGDVVDFQNGATVGNLQKIVLADGKELTAR